MQLINDVLGLHEGGPLKLDVERLAGAALRPSGGVLCVHALDVAAETLASLHFLFGLLPVREYGGWGVDRHTMLEMADEKMPTTSGRRSGFVPSKKIPEHSSMMVSARP